MSRFNLSHLDISGSVSNATYKSKSQFSRSERDRNREEHGKRLINDLNAAFELAETAKTEDDRIDNVEGIYLEITLEKGTNPESIERKNDKVSPGATKVDENDNTKVALYVPDQAKAVLQQILTDYTTGQLTKTGKPQRKQFVESLEEVRSAQFESFWTDTNERLPKNDQEEIWWSAWCFPDFENKLELVATKLGARVADSDQRLYFPESTVIPVLATKPLIELILFAACGVFELRCATDTPTFFTDTIRDTQYEWSDDLASRVIWPGANAPAVCLLDTGVNRAHSLIAPALSASDLYSLQQDWGADDHFDPIGHGTPMAGLILHGDLMTSLTDSREHILEHRLESVKILPPNGFDEDKPNSYGVITQMAISLPTIPERKRVYCLAVTDNKSGEKPSTWSAAVDQAAAGVMVGDEENAPKRLFLISAGNIVPEVDYSRIEPADHYPIEDPAQAWNALTVGGYTDKNYIDDEGYSDWSPLAATGDLSPFSRTSVAWPHNKAPIKPEIVMEAGNRAVSPSKTEVLTLDSLSLLSTGKEVDNFPLTSFEATSAATAQAARLAARLIARFPDYWPETIRALIIHSAEWTLPMLTALNETRSKRDNYKLVRRFGYGVKSNERAVASATNHLALINQASIQPFKIDKGTRKFNECHYYKLPWPKAALEQLENAKIKLKITLSYFIEPNPGLSASIIPQRYQSFGLRFDLKRKNETETDFKKRVNGFELKKGEKFTSTVWRK